MKKLDSKQHKETPEEELKRLRKRVTALPDIHTPSLSNVNGCSTWPYPFPARVFELRSTLLLAQERDTPIVP